MLESVPLVPTVGVIAQRLGQPVSRIEYIINARRIRASGKAGNARVFTEADVTRITNEMRRIDDRAKGNAQGVRDAR